MSLERIDQYMKEIKAIRDYESKCQQLNEAWSLTSHLQKELNENELIISLYKDRVKEQNFTITNLENALREAREEVSNLGKSVGTNGEQIQHKTKKSDHFKDSRPNDFVALGIPLKHAQTFLERKESANIFDVTEADWERLEKGLADNEHTDTCQS